MKSPREYHRGPDVVAHGRLPTQHYNVVTDIARWPLFLLNTNFSLVEIESR